MNWQYTSSRWVEDPFIIYDGEQTQEAMRLLPAYNPHPIPVHRIEHWRKKPFHITGAAVAAAWEQYVGRAPADSIFRQYWDESTKTL